jgi:hypothetical protein
MMHLLHDCCLHSNFCSTANGVVQFVVRLVCRFAGILVLCWLEGMVCLQSLASV